MADILNIEKQRSSLFVRYVSELLVLILQMASHFGLEKVPQFEAVQQTESVSTEVLRIIGVVCLICFVQISYSVYSILRRRIPRCT
jgi:hypothetical protein